MSLVEKEFEQLKKKLLESNIDITNSTIEDIIYHFEDALNSEYKKKHGVVYTPQWLADTMAYLAINTYFKNKLGFELNDQNKLNSTFLNELRGLKILDPCVGSGVYAFSLIKVLLDLYKKAYTNIGIEFNELDIILYIIVNTIYLMDIDTNAARITKFRLWAFCCEKGYTEDFNTFKCTIIIGDAVNTKFNGLEINYDRELSNVDDMTKRMYIDSWHTTWNNIVELSNNVEKDSHSILKAKANLYNLALNISHDIVGEEIEYKYTWKMLKNKAVRKELNWFIEFNDIFENRGGFDIIIGNPPYVRNADTKVINTDILKSNADLYMFFLDLVFYIGNENAVSCMVTPNKWFSSAYAKDFREAKLKHLCEIVDFNAHWIFENAFVPTAITIMSKEKETDVLTYSNCENIVVDKATDNSLEYIGNNAIEIRKENLKLWDKFIFGNESLYESLTKLKVFPKLRDAYDCVITRGIVIDESERQNGDPNSDGFYIAKGEDILKFGVLNKTKQSTNKKVDLIWDELVAFPEITREIRACKLGPDVIPLDSVVLLKSKNKNVVALLNTKIYNAIYNITTCTNYMIGYAQVKFPRKTKVIGDSPVPLDLSKLDSLREETNNWCNVTDSHQEELEKIVQSLYSLTDEEVVILNKYNK